MSPFQVQPSGSPAGNQAKMGLPSSAARFRASQTSVSQGMVDQGASPGCGLMTVCNFANSVGAIAWSAETTATASKAGTMPKMARHTVAIEMNLLDICYSFVGFGPK